MSATPVAPRPDAPRPDPRRARPRRVLVLVDSYWTPHGGTEGQIRSLVSHLPAGWEAEMWTLQPTAWLAKNRFPCPVRVLGARGILRPSGARSVLAISRALERRRFDLVHTFMPDAGALGALAGARAGAPVLVSRRDLGFWQTPRRTALLRRTDRVASAFAVNCAAVKDVTVDREHVPPGTVAVIPNGHDPAAFDVPADATLRARLGIPPEARLIGLLANLKPIKRPQDLVDAFARLAEAVPDVHAVFLGDGDAASVTERAAARGVADRVHVLPWTGPVAAVLRHLTVGVLCSETEGLSNAVIEYMACGLPVVATGVGGTPDLVEDGANGLLYPPGDVVALAAGLRRLLGDASLAEAMGRESRRRFEARYTLRRMVGDTVGLYERLLAPPPAAEALTFEVLEDLARIEALADDWRALLLDGRTFAGPDWALAWWQSSVAPRPFVVVTRDAGGRLAGVLALERRGRDLAFPGAGYGADHLDVVARPDLAEAVARGVLEALLTVPWRRLRLEHLAEDAALRLALRTAPRPAPFTERAATICYCADTRGGWEAYLKRLARRHRSEVRRRLRLVRETADVGIRRVVDPKDVEPALDLLFRLHEVRFRAQGEATRFAGARIRAFHGALATRLAARGDLRLLVYAHQGRDVAAWYGLRQGSTLSYFQGGFDPAASALAPGLALQAVALADEVAGAGLAELDFLDGEETYKREMATGRRRLFDVTVFRPGLLGRVRQALDELPRLARDVVRPRPEGNA